jgi:hypothetical protein
MSPMLCRNCQCECGEPKDSPKVLEAETPMVFFQPHGPGYSPALMVGQTKVIFEDPLRCLHIGRGLVDYAIHVLAKRLQG